jgi:DNA repair ATPase RecN
MDYMDEYDPDWIGDPKISTLKRMAFNAQRDIIQLQNAVASESAARVGKNITHEEQIKNLQNHMVTIKKQNSISNLFFMGIITKEEAKTLWDQYKSPDEENHRMADATIETLTNKQYDS